MRVTSPYNFAVIDAEPVLLGGSYIVESAAGMFVTPIGARVGKKLSDFRADEAMAVKRAFRYGQFEKKLAAACAAVHKVGDYPVEEDADALAEILTEEGADFVERAASAMSEKYTPSEVAAAWGMMRGRVRAEAPSAVTPVSESKVEDLKPPSPSFRRTLRESAPTVSKLDRMAALFAMSRAGLLECVLEVTKDTLIDLSAAPDAVLRRAVLCAEYPGSGALH